MSDQTTREAAARAWYAEPSAALQVALVRALRIGGVGKCWPDGVYRREDGALSAWLAWAKADAAKAVPAREADALEWSGLLDFANPRAVLEWATQPARFRSEAWRGFAHFGVDGRDGWPLDAFCNASRNGGPSAAHALVAAHARAQLARESAPAQPAALTLDEIREAAKARGYRVVHESGWERPDVVLAFLTAYATMTEGDANRWLDERPSSHAEIASLRALGVTPAVLS